MGQRAAIGIATERSVATRRARAHVHPDQRLVELVRRGVPVAEQLARRLAAERRHVQAGPGLCGAAKEMVSPVLST